MSKNPSLLDIDRSKIKIDGLKKKRRPKKDSDVSHADIVAYNSRDHMRCVETRQRFNPNGDHIGPVGMRSTNETAMVEKAKVRLPPIQLAAYLAKIENHQQSQNMLVDELELIISGDARREGWRHDGGDEKYRLLASLVVEQWISPRKFWKEKLDSDAKFIRVQVVSSFARVMGCKRQGWHGTWNQYFMRYEDMPARWYAHGQQLV